jgi:hypothetical protein
MRSRILLSVVLATTITMLAACGGRSMTPSEVGGESSTAAAPSSSVGSTTRQVAHPGPPHAPTPASSSASTKPAGSPAQSDPPSKPKPAPPHQPSAGPVRFGPVPASKDPTVVTSISPDRKTLTTTFSALEVSVDDESTKPDATRSFTLLLPLTGAGQNANVTVHASGYAFVTKGATARLTLKVNGRTIVNDFRPNWDDDFARTLDLPAIPGSTYQLSVVLEVHKIPGSRGPKTAYLNVVGRVEESGVARSRG